MSARSTSRLQISPAFSNLVRDLPHKKCVIIDKFKATQHLPPPHTRTLVILSLSMRAGMWHNWYIYMLRQQCTVVHFFNTIHILINYVHNFVSAVSMRIKTGSV